MNQNIHVISCNMDNRNPEEIARELVDNIIQIFDELMEKQDGEDCVKEELSILRKAGAYGGKLCNKVTMEIIKRKLGY